MKDKDHESVTHYQKGRSPMVRPSRTSVALPVLFLVLSAASAFAKGNPVHGKELYVEYCVGCHGEKGDGKGPYGAMLNPQPRDFTKGDFKYGKTDEDLFGLITKGKAPMPSWSGLTDDDRWDLVAYIRTLKKK